MSEARLQLANAPCSWGTLEFAGLGGGQVPYARMLDELVDSGYVGTELGDWGYMPTEPGQLRQAITGRGLSLRGAFVPVALSEESAHEEGLVRAVRTALLLSRAGDSEDPPLLVLADANGRVPQRVWNAGRITPDLGLSMRQWETVALGAASIAQGVLNQTGLRTVFHHHCAGYVETPEEIARLLAMTDPQLLGLVFDTGHYVYGSGNQEVSVLEGLEAFGDRVWYVHFKDCHPAVARHARTEGLGYFEAVEKGLFCELGQGCVDFARVLSWLHKRAYDGWIVVEQDVLPGMGSPKESAERNRRYMRLLGL
ncbi:MAG: TIM barrel protein [Bacteroidota bacterium]|nr:TIM barrel protein [Bacteroidota bacterium]